MDERFNHLAPPCCLCVSMLFTRKQQEGKRTKNSSLNFTAFTPLSQHANVCSATRVQQHTRQMPTHLVAVTKYVCLLYMLSFWLKRFRMGEVQRRRRRKEHRGFTQFRELQPSPSRGSTVTVPFITIISQTACAHTHTHPIREALLTDLCLHSHT